jgi:hypothetical protein
VDSTGLATIRRDGFASMDADAGQGALTTVPVRFSGRLLFVNVDSEAGELRAEILDREGTELAPFTLANSTPLRVDSQDLSALAGKPVRFRFHLRHARLYAFWVSAEASGASRGYVAAGGPGFTGPVDDKGSEIYRHCCAADIRH